MRYTLLAGQPELYDVLYGEKAEIENVEWQTPTSVEEVEEVLDDFRFVMSQIG